MARYKITCRCVKCGFKYSHITKNPEAPDPPCPRPVRYDDGGKAVETCGTESVPIGMDLSWQKAPASIGGNIAIKALDETASIVMQDYGMTDMRDDVRQGEAAAPKLPPGQQARADAFFSGGGQTARRMRINPGAHAAAAMRGALTDPQTADRSIGAVHRSRYRPGTQIINAPGSERV